VFVLGEVTKMMTPDDVVVFLNRVTRYDQIPTDMDGLLESVRSGSLSLYKFDEDATLMVNTVSQWFGEGEIVSVVLRTQGKRVVYTLSEVNSVTGSSLTWWWRRFKTADYRPLMEAVEQGRGIQYRLLEARDNRFMVQEAVQVAWNTAREIPGDYSLQFFRKVFEGFGSSVDIRPLHTWQPLDDCDPQEWNDFLENGGDVRIRGKDTVVRVGDKFTDGHISWWKTLIQGSDLLRVLQVAKASGVMSSPDRFSYRNLYRHAEGYREDLSDVSAARNDAALSQNGRVHIVDMFVTVRDASPVVYMLSNHGGRYDWREFNDLGVISSYLHRVGWRDSNQ
jgi:hypothetical protein